jgi:hypothetical protein
MLLGMKEPYKKGESESILASSLAASIARCWSKRRQRYRWAGLLSFEKRVNQDADSLLKKRKATWQVALDASGQPVLRSLRTRAR